MYFGMRQHALNLFFLVPTRLKSPTNRPQKQLLRDASIVGA